MSCGIDAKFLDGKNVTYASDSEEESDDVTQEQDCQLPQFQDVVSGPKTGPKGVLEDYRVYKEMKQREDDQALRNKIELHKQFAFSADPNKFPDKEKTGENSDDEFDDDDEFLQRYHQKRMLELKQEVEAKLNSGLKKYSKSFELTGDELLNTIESEDRRVVIIVHLYDNNLPVCRQMNNCFDTLASQYPYTKFCKVNASTASLSLQFKAKALPTIQVYKEGTLIGNFIKMMDYLDEEFFVGDVENFLLDSNIISCLSNLSSEQLEDFDLD